MKALGLFLSNYSIALVLAIFTWLVWGIAFTVATAAPQGDGAGTLPIVRQTGLLSHGQLCIARTSPCVLVIGSTQDTPRAILAEYLATDHAPAGAHDPQVIVTTWTSHGKAVEVHTPRWENESGDQGAAHWAKRHAEAVEALQRPGVFPPDPPPPSSKG